jgi:hypothetical protein
VVRINDSFADLEKHGLTPFRGQQFTTGVSQLPGRSARAAAVGRLNSKQVSVGHSRDSKPFSLFWRVL